MGPGAGLGKPRSAIPCSAAGPGHVGSALHHPGRLGSVRRFPPASQAEVQVEAWGHRGFAVTSTGSLPASSCLELDQAEWENIPGSKQRCRNIIPLNLEGNPGGYCFGTSKQE